MYLSLDKLRKIDHKIWQVYKLISKLSNLDSVTDLSGKWYVVVHSREYESRPSEPLIDTAELSHVHLQEIH